MTFCDSHKEFSLKTSQNWIFDIKNEIFTYKDVFLDIYNYGQTYLEWKWKLDYISKMNKKLHIWNNIW